MKHNLNIFPDGSEEEHENISHKDVYEQRLVRRGLSKVEAFWELLGLYLGQETAYLD